MAVIELARPGQEATTYEFIITCANAAATINGIISTQLLTPMKSVGCDDDGGNCPSDTVDVTDKAAFMASDGPRRFTYYTLLLTGISISSCFLFTRFLPASKDECHEWKAKGDAMGASAARGRIAMFMAICVIGVRIDLFSLLLQTLDNHLLFLLLFLVWINRCHSVAGHQDSVRAGDWWFGLLKTADLSPDQNRFNFFFIPSFFASSFFLIFSVHVF